MQGVLQIYDLQVVPALLIQVAFQMHYIVHLVRPILNEKITNNKDEHARLVFYWTGDGELVRGT